MNKSIFFIPVAAALVAMGGCATSHHDNLARSADRLERNADVLARDRTTYSSPSYGREADQLAQKSHDFRRTVMDTRGDRHDLDEAFESLSRSYHELRDDVEKSDSREAQLDLKPVTEAYLDVEREMGGYRASDRYAHDRDRDRYSR
jgi:hypothetical protein